MPSAELSAPRTRLALAAGVALAAAALSGCVSTQTKNARTLLVNQRTLDSQAAVRVTRPNPDVAVSAVQLIRAGAGAAAVVTVHNLTSHPVSDLPISLELRTSPHRATSLNGAPNLPYFNTHVAAIGASASTVWVLTLHHLPKVRRAVPFAIVGSATRPASIHDGSLPQLRVISSSARGGRLELSVSNPSGVTQYGLPVYAVATRNGRDVGATSGSIAELGDGERVTLQLKLFGTATGATLQLSAPPTIFK